MIRRLVAPAVAMLLILLCGAQSAAAQTYRLSPIQDTDVRANGGGTANCGGCTQIATRTHSTGEFRSLYQFDLAGIPASSRVTSATLRIWVTSADNSAVTIHRVTQSWSEYTLTWQNSGGVSHNAASSASFTPAQAARYHDIDVTALVGQWRSGTPNYGLILKIGGNNSYAAYTSREWGTASQRPELVIVTEAAPALSAVSSTAVTSDTYNSATNPKLIPGAVALRSVMISNSGAGYPDSNTVTVVQRVPTQSTLFVGDLGSAGSGPVSFVQGTPSSALTYSFSSLSSTTDDLAFSNDNGATFNYTPVAGADGYDAAVTHIRVSPKGTFAGSGASGDPSFTLRFRIKVK
jgi:hypothetical protein